MWGGQFSEKQPLENGTFEGERLVFLVTRRLLIISGSSSQTRYTFNGLTEFPFMKLTRRMNNQQLPRVKAAAERVITA